MKRLRCSYRRFTLVELLVAMAVFVVMLGLMLRFFSGTQRVWRGLRERNEVFADARVAMDLVESLLNSSVAIDGFTPLAVNGSVSSIWFLSNSPRTLLPEAASPDPPDPDNDVLDHIYLVCVDRTDAECADPEWGENRGVLRIGVNVTPNSRFSSSSPLGAAWFKPSAFTTDVAVSTLFSSSAMKVIPVVDRVSELTFRSLLPASEDPARNRPQSIEITLKIFDTIDNYQRWRGMADSADKETFRAQHEYTFRRIVNFEDVAEPIEE